MGSSLEKYKSQREKCNTEQVAHALSSCGWVKGRAQADSGRVMLISWGTPSASFGEKMSQNDNDTKSKISQFLAQIMVRLAESPIF